MCSVDSLARFSSAVDRFWINTPMRAREILPKKTDERTVVETDGSLSAIPGRSFTPDNSKKAKARRTVEKVLNDMPSNK